MGADLLEHFGGSGAEGIPDIVVEGANLNAVSLYLNRELTSDELSVLIELLRSIKIENVNGIDAAFFNIENADFDGEMGSVVHKLQDVENYILINISGLVVKGFYKFGFVNRDF